MIVLFIGHSALYNCTALSEKVKKVILEHIPPHIKPIFYCGGYGDFDHLCAHICRSLRENNFNCEIVFITPYITQTQQKKIKYFIDTKLYDSVIYPPLEHIQPRFAISERNKWMIEQADLIISHVTHSFCGAYKGLEYARKRSKNIINIE